MCTVVILRRPEHDWPIIVAANRDEQINRSWKGPARHRFDRPDVIAGLDELGGGSWLGINEFGVFACILNRQGTLGPQADKRSRGEIVLDALDFEDSAAAVETIAHIDGQAFRDFNMIVADNRDAYCVKLASDQSSTAQISGIPEGYSMLTAGELNDVSCNRIKTFLPKFKSAPAPNPGVGDWSIWPELMASSSLDGNPGSAMCFLTESGFGTSSSALLALPSIDSALHEPPARVEWKFASGPPDSSPYERIPL